MAAHGIEQSRRGRQHRSHMLVLTGDVEHRDGADRAGIDDVGHRTRGDDPVQAVEPLFDRPRQRGCRAAASIAAPGDHHLGRRQLVELIDDLAAGRARQADGGDQRRQAEHRPERRQQVNAPAGRTARRASRRTDRQIASGCAGGGARSTLASLADPAADGRRRHLGEPAVDDPDLALGADGDVAIVRDQAHRQAARHELVEQLQDRGRVGRVEVAGRLVAQQDRRLDGQAPVPPPRVGVLRPTGGRAGTWPGAASRPAPGPRSTRRRRSRLDRPWYIPPNITFSSAVRWASRWNDWNTNPSRAARSHARSRSEMRAVSRPSSS